MRPFDVRGPIDIEATDRVHLHSRLKLWAQRDCRTSVNIRVYLGFRGFRV